ncbi:hypothetical protein HDU93_004921 [Gonapodya sp. JEL0774]|nr:hypothetical protein HDU93_004921 [Gonapodya sp. JEL0774]
MGGRETLDTLDIAISGYVDEEQHALHAAPHSSLPPPVPGSSNPGSPESAGAGNPIGGSSPNPSVLSKTPSGAGNDMEEDPEVAAVTAELEKLGMNPGRFSLGVMRRLVPAEEPRYDLLEKYFDLILYMVIHPGTFYRTLTQQSPLLLNAMYCSAEVLSRSTVPNREQGMTAGSLPNGEYYFGKARRLLSLGLEEPCFGTVVALCKLSIYASGSGRVNAGWMYSGMALRMIVGMRWNEPVSPETLSTLTPLEYETRKRVWWYCFLFDAAVSVIAGRSSSINPDEPMIDYPDDDLWNSMDDNGVIVGKIYGHSSVAGSKLQAMYPSVCYREIAKIWHVFARVSKYVRQSKSQRTAIGRVDERLSDLGLQLKNLWTEVPERVKREYSPRRDASGNVLPGELKQFAGNTEFHWVFHCASIMLHRPERLIHDFVWPTRSSFDVCTYSAERITSILARWLEIEPALSHIMAAMTYPIFEAGMVHMVNALVSSLIPAQASGLSTESPSQELIARSRHYLAVTIQALNVLRRYFASAEAYFSVLSKAARDNGIL